MHHDVHCAGTGTPNALRPGHLAGAHLEDTVIQQPLRMWGCGEIEQTRGRRTARALCASRALGRFGGDLSPTAQRKPFTFFLPPPSAFFALAAAAGG